MAELIVSGLFRENNSAMQRGKPILTQTVIWLNSSRDQIRGSVKHETSSSIHRRQHLLCLPTTPPFTNRSKRIIPKCLYSDHFAQFLPPTMPSPPSPVSFRPRPRRSVSSVSRRSQSRQSLSLRLLRQARALIEKGERLFLSLFPLQRAGVVALGVFFAVTSVLSLIYHEAIFHWMSNFAKGWRNITAGWLILWALTFVVSFPPLIGYSTCVGLGGFVYGFPNGYVWWFCFNGALGSDSV
jgi:hypothetical protein